MEKFQKYIISMLEKFQKHPISMLEKFQKPLLRCHGFDVLYYYNSKKNGEIDFLIEKKSKVIPLEIKSGKDYARHLAVNNLLNKDYDINEAYVFNNENVIVKEKITYYPIYMIDFLYNN